MVIYICGAADDGARNRAEARVTRVGAVEWRVDGELVYRVPEPEWGLFCQAMLGASTLPPALLAPKWATHGLGVAFLDCGQRLALLHALSQLACAVPLAALFQEAPFGPLRAAEVFFGRSFHDGYGNRLAVPDDDVQERLARRRADRETLFDAGCLFEVGVADHAGKDITFWVRPYRCPGAGADWTPGARELREAVERGSQRLVAGL